MGAIRVMQTRKSNADIVDQDIQRREGMRSLGGLIIAMNAQSENEHAAQLAAAMQSLIASSGADTYEVYYEGGGGADPIKLTRATATGVNVQCEHGAGGNHVMLKCWIDSDNGTNRGMDVIFPHPDVRGDYLYLREAATDVREFPSADDPITKAQEYLATFKLLSRCK